MSMQPDTSCWVELNGVVAPTRPTAVIGTLTPFTDPAAENPSNGLMYVKVDAYGNTLATWMYDTAADWVLLNENRGRMYVGRGIEGPSGVGLPMAEAGEFVFDQSAGHLLMYAGALNGGWTPVSVLPGDTYLDQLTGNIYPVSPTA